MISVVAKLRNHASLIRFDSTINYRPFESMKKTFKNHAVLRGKLNKTKVGRGINVGAARFVCAHCCGRAIVTTKTSSASRRGSA